MIVNNIQPCSKQCLLILLAHVGARIESTTCVLYSFNSRPDQFSHTCIGIVHKTKTQDMQYALRVLHFSAFHCVCF